MISSKHWKQAPAFATASADKEPAPFLFSKHWKPGAPAGIKFSKGWKNSILLWIAMAVSAVAQEPGMEISGFRVPDYDEQGTMTSQLFGDRAVMEGSGKVKITGVNMEFYKDGETYMTVTSPHCFFDQKTREAWSEAPVAADMEGVHVRGRGFRLQSSDRKVQVLNDSKVIIEDVMEQNDDLSGIESLDTNEVTVITSKELFLDYNGRTVRFEETVHVQDPQMAMDCGTMNVRFGENNEIDWIEALTEVKLLSEGREAYAGRAVYDITTDEFLLEDKPKIVDGRNMLLGERIRFWRATGRMVCEPSARLIIYSDDKLKTDIFEN